MTEQKTDIRLGWIGTGNMGGPMAARLCKAGYDVTVCGSGRRDLTPYANEVGAKVALNPTDLATKVDIIFTMIPSGKELIPLVEQVTKTDFAGKIFIDMSTVDPVSSAEAAEMIAKADGSFLRAPVSGSTSFAEKGELSIMVSGDRDIFEKCLPYFEVLGNRQTYLGQREEARQMKILINMVLGDEMQALSEAIVLGEKLGLPKDAMLDLIANSAAGAPLFSYKSKILKSMDFTASSSVYNQHKDMKMAMELADEAGINVPSSKVTMQMYEELMSRGMEQLDNIAVYLANKLVNEEKQS